MTVTREDSPVLWGLLDYLLKFFLLTLGFVVMHEAIIFLFDLVVSNELFYKLKLMSLSYFGYYGTSYYIQNATYTWFAFHGPYDLLEVTLPLIVSYFALVVLSLPPLKSVKQCLKAFFLENKLVLLLYFVIHFSMCLIFPWLPSLSIGLQVALISTIFSLIVYCVLLFSFPSKLTGYLDFNVSRTTLFWASNLFWFLVTLLMLCFFAAFCSISIYGSSFSNYYTHAYRMVFIESFWSYGLVENLMGALGREDYFTIGLLCFFPLYFFTGIISLISGLLNSRKLPLNPWFFGIIMISLYTVVIYLGLGENPFMFFYDWALMILYVFSFLMMEAVLWWYLRKLSTQSNE